jgi:hypothetical protein
MYAYSIRRMALGFQQLGLSGGFLRMQAGAAVPQGLDDVFRDHTLGHLQTVGDFPVCSPLQPVEQQGPPAFGRQFAHGYFQLGNPLLGVQGILGRRCRTGCFFRGRFDAERPPTGAKFSQIVYREIGCDTKKEGSRVLDIDGRPHAHEMHVGILSAIGSEITTAELVGEEPQEIVVMLFEGSETGKCLFILHDGSYSRR